MAHFAQLDDDNFVLQVIVVNNSECLDENGNESEAVGVAFCKSILGEATRWKQTSYNGNMRYNYAGLGYQYDPVRNAFISPKPYASWVLNETTCRWDAPTPCPTDGKTYGWDEATTSWVEIEYPSPYPSWVKNATTGRWEAPTPVPDDGKKYSWDEATVSWVEVTV